MPYDVYGGAMAPSLDGNGVILVGGTIYSSGHTDTILGHRRPAYVTTK